jgi:hypothetical protein
MAAKSSNSNFENLEKLKESIVIHTIANLNNDIKVYVNNSLEELYDKINIEIDKDEFIKIANNVFGIDKIAKKGKGITYADLKGKVITETTKSRKGIQRKLPDENSRCIEKTKNNDRCKNAKAKDSEYCTRHKNLKDETSTTKKTKKTKKSEINDNENDNDNNDNDNNDNDKNDNMNDDSDSDSDSDSEVVTIDDDGHHIDSNNNLYEIDDDKSGYVIGIKKNGKVSLKKDFQEKFGVKYKKWIKNNKN